MLCVVGIGFLYFAFVDIDRKILNDIINGEPNDLSEDEQLEKVGLCRGSTRRLEGYWRFCQNPKGKLSHGEVSAEIRTNPTNLVKSLF